MTAKLVVENLKHRPMRSLLSIFLIAIPVTLILSLVGLAEGMMQDSARRQQGVGADVWVRPGDSTALTLSGAPLPEKLVPAIAARPHVAAATGMVTYPVNSVSYAAGIDLAGFTRMSGGFDYVAGGPFRRPDDVIVDRDYAAQNKLHVGSMVTLLNRQWHVVGIVEPGKLSHIFIQMKVLQDFMSSTGKVSQIFVKADKPANVPAVVADLRQFLPGYKVYDMKELLSQWTVAKVQNGAVNTFINVMEGIGVVIGFAVVLLSMYMAVLQRTREIGILKSLGASRWFILKTILHRGRG